MSDEQERIMVMPAFAFKEACSKIENQADLLEETRHMYYAYMNTPGSVAMMRRDIAEHNTDVLQPIPYAVIYHLDAENIKEYNPETLMENIHVLCYKRGEEGGESRLHNTVSIGFGGHINTEDVNNALADWPNSNPFTQCVQRELLEELNINCGIAPDRELFTGAVFYDPSTEVSSLHICESVFFCVNDKEGITAKEDCIKQLSWKSLKELIDIGNESGGFESWTVNIISYMTAVLMTADMNMFNEEAKEEPADTTDPAMP